MRWTPLPLEAPLAAYEAQATELLDAWLRRDSDAIQLIRQRLPRFLRDDVPWLPRSMSEDEVLATTLDEADARLALADTENQWTVALIGHNLTNDRNQMFGTTNSLLNAGTYFGAIRPPASYWVQFEKRF